jgi:hypothetical protein
MSFDIYTKEGLEEMSAKLDGIVLHNVATTTAVPEKDIPKAPEPILHGAPETVEDAIKRILELEMKLEDLSRAAEIASITRQFEILDSFKAEADRCLESKITIEQPSTADLKLTVITGELDVDKLKKENA